MSDSVESPASAPESAFSVARVLAVLLAVAAVGGIIWLGSWLSTLTAAGTPKAHGRVTWNGEPVTKGAVMAKHESDPTLGPIGSLDQEGRFELLNNMQPGIPTGRYKLRVASFSDGMPPRPLVPKVYTEFSTTPIEVDVSANPDKNYFEIELKGELPAQSQGPPTGPASPEAESSDDSPESENTTESDADTPAGETDSE